MRISDWSSDVCSSDLSAARWLANKENAADLIGGTNIKDHDKQLASVLLDLSTTAQISDSLKLGKDVLSQIGGIRLHKSRSDESRLGKEGVSTCRTRGSPDH